MYEFAYPLVARHDRAISEIYWLCIYDAVPNTWRRRALDLDGRMITVVDIHTTAIQEIVSPSCTYTRHFATYTCCTSLGTSADSSTRSMLATSSVTYTQSCK